MSGDARKLVEAMHREAMMRHSGDLPAPKPQVIDHTELPEANPDDELGVEWNLYRRDISRWLGEGREGQFVLIKGEEILGFFDSWDGARTAGLKRFVRELFFVHEIRAKEPILRVRGLNFPCPS